MKLKSFGKVFRGRRQKLKCKVVERTRKNILQRRNTKNLQNILANCR